MSGVSYAHSLHSLYSTPLGDPTAHHFDSSRHCPAVWAQAISLEPNILSLHISYFALEQKSTQSKSPLGQFTPFRLHNTPP